MKEWDDIWNNASEAFEQTEFEIKDSYREDLIQKLDQFQANSGRKKRTGGWYFFLLDLLLVAGCILVIHPSFIDAENIGSSQTFKEETSATTASEYPSQKEKALLIEPKAQQDSVQGNSDNISATSKSRETNAQSASTQALALSGAQQVSLSTSLQNEQAALHSGRSEERSKNALAQEKRETATSPFEAFRESEQLTAAELSLLDARRIRPFEYITRKSIFPTEFKEAEQKIHPRAHQRRPKGKWSLHLSGGMQWSIPQQKEASDFLVGASNVQTSNLLSPSLHFGARRYISGRIEIGVGFQYSQMGEAVSFQTTASQFSTLQIKESDTSYIIEDRSYWRPDSTRPGMDSVLVVIIDTVTTITHVTRDSLIEDSVLVQHQGKNSYHLYELPLFLSFAVLERPSWRVHLQPGVSFGYVNIRSNLLNPYLSEEGQASSRKWMISSSLYGAVERRITKDLWLHLGMGGQYTLYSGLEMAGEKRRYLLFQTRLGVTYIF